jgi:glutamyl-tRNA synthetase
MHAVVVDDHDMGVTHIIRGDDHLTNAGRQKILFDALGWELPVMAHIPLIHGSDGAKLSKRHGALGVDAYRAMGYLPEAMRNYLVRLGWSHGDDEIMSTGQMIEWFDIDAINRGAARFDFAKLESVNAHYLRARSDEELVNLLVGELPHLAGGEAFEVRLDEARRRQLGQAMPLLKERAKSLVDLVNGAHFIVAERPLPLDETAEKLLDTEARKLLASVVPVLAAAAEWSAPALETAVKAHAEKEGLKLGKLAQPLRAALTGRATSPGIFDVLAILGRDESLARIGDQVRM